MKKLVAIIMLIAFGVLLVGCSSDNNVIVKNKTLRNRFVKVAKDTSYSIYVDTETDVMYLVMRPSVDQFGLTVLVNADGKPLLYSESDLHYEYNFEHSVN